MQLTHDGVTLRAVEPDHLDRVVAYLGHEDLIGVRSIEGDRNRPMSQTELMAAVESFPKPEHGEVYGIWSGNELVGHTHTDCWWDVHTPSLDLVIAPDHRRRRFGTAAARLMLLHLFEDTLARMTHVWIPDWNAAGLGLAGSLGFEQIGRVRRTGLREGRYVDTIVLQLSREQWQEATWR